MYNKNIFFYLLLIDNPKCYEKSLNLCEYNIKVVKIWLSLTNDFEFL